MKAAAAAAATTTTAEAAIFTHDPHLDLAAGWNPKRSWLREILPIRCPELGYSPSCAPEELRCSL